MLSSSGGNSRTDQTPATSKIKSTVTKNPASTHGYSTMGKNGKVLKNTNNPISPSFQLINENPPIHLTLHLNSMT
jgi:hypothetical protein